MKNRQKAKGFLFFFIMNSALFYSFNNSFNRTAKIFIQRIYSINKKSDYSFNKNICLKNAVSATPRMIWTCQTWVDHKRIPQPCKQWTSLVIITEPLPVWWWIIDDAKDEQWARLKRDSLQVFGIFCTMFGEWLYRVMDDRVANCFLKKKNFICLGCELL